MQLTLTFDATTSLSATATQLRLLATALEKLDASTVTPAIPKLPEELSNARITKKASPANGNGHAEPKKRGRPKKVEEAVEVSDDDDSSNEEDSDLGFEDEQEEGPSEYTLAQVKAAAREFATNHNSEQVRKVLSRFGVKNINDLGEEQFAQAVKAFGA